MSGSSDSTLRVWDLVTGEMLNVVKHHSDAVLHLRLHFGTLVTCSKVSDFTYLPFIFTIIFISVESKVCITCLLNLVYSIDSHSQDRSIAVWDMKSPNDITLVWVLVGHRAAVNVVDLDDKYIVSASGDRTIKVRRGL